MRHNDKDYNRMSLGSIRFLLYALLVVAFVTLFPSVWVARLLAKLSPDVLYHVETKELLVALTIDDVPDRDTTPRILDVLQKHGAHATFFVITSQIAENENVINRILEEKHELANHLEADYPAVRLSPAEFERQLAETHRQLSRFTSVRWYRPSNGLYSQAMLSILRRHGYKCVLGSVYPFDTQLPSVHFSTQYINWNVRPGAIIILHDRGDRGKRTALVLDELLPKLEQRGYRVVTLTELANSGAARNER
jgi:peptidoglycan-N-acetylglucosamine deacetylase